MLRILTNAAIYTCYHSKTNTLNLKIINMKNLFFYKIICSIMILSIFCACSSDNVLAPEESDIPTRSNDLVAGPGCPYHLGVCPSDCFSGGAYHPCLNPDHMGMQKQTEIGIICEGCINDNDPTTPTLPVPQPKYCDACKECQACVHIRKYMDENGNSNGYMPSQPYIHTCNTLTGGCIQCICCKSNNLQ